MTRYDAIIKFIFLFLVILLILLTFDNNKTMKETSNNVKNITDLLNNLIINNEHHQ